jgi:chromosomal replication initiator protein
MDNLIVGLPDWYFTEHEISELPTIDRIQRVVADFYGLKKSDMLTDARAKDLHIPRQTAMYLSRCLTNRTMELIGKKFRRDHSTAVYSIRKIERIVKRGGQLANDVEVLKRRIAGETLN